jgi:hypothetical protein
MIWTGISKKRKYTVAEIILFDFDRRIRLMFQILYFSLFLLQFIAHRFNHSWFGYAIEDIVFLLDCELIGFQYLLDGRLPIVI